MNMNEEDRCFSPDFLSLILGKSEIDVLGEELLGLIGIPKSPELDSLLEL